MSSGALKVAVFRAPEAAAATQTLLAARGFEAVLAPVTTIVARPATLPSQRFDFVVATSARAFGPGAALAGLPLYVVGEKTAQAARRAGLAPAPAADDVASLLPRLPPGRALYLAGHDRKPDLEAALSGRVVIVETYAARARADWTPDEAAGVAGAAAALHFSARGAELAMSLAARAGVGAADVAAQADAGRAARRPGIGAGPTAGKGLTVIFEPGVGRRRQVLTFRAAPPRPAR